MAKILLSKEAESDLRNIIRFTQKTWGDSQVAKYRKLINSKLASIAKNELPDKLFSSSLDGIFFSKIGSHFVFYLRPSDRKIIVLAFLHPRSEILKHLRDRM